MTTDSKKAEPTAASRHPLLNLRIPLWEQVRQVRQVIGEALTDLPEEVRLAAMMTASELLENALKYRSSGDGAPPGFALDVGPAAVRIEVSNAADPARMHELAHRLERIRAAEDSGALYRERLQELMLNPDQGGGLGLYRIVYEGKFDLHSRSDGELITIIAVRKLS